MVAHLHGPIRVVTASSRLLRLDQLGYARRLYDSMSVATCVAELVLADSQSKVVRTMLMTYVGVELTAPHQIVAQSVIDHQSSARAVGQCREPGNPERLRRQRLSSMSL